jgi:hypothetical protein
MKIFYRNHLFQSGTFSATNASTTLPEENAGNIHLAKVFRTGGTGSSVLTFTGSVAQSFGFFAAYRPGGLTLTSITHGDGVGTPTTVLAAAMSTLGNWIYYIPGSATAGQKVYTYTTSSSGAQDTGVVFMAPAVTLDQAPYSDGLEINPVDKSSREESISGQVFAEVGARYNRYTLTWTNASHTTKQQLFALWESVGIHEPFMMQIATTAPYNDLLYVLLTAPPTATANVAQRWDLTLEFMDAL